MTLRRLGTSYDSVNWNGKYYTKTEKLFAWFANRIGQFVCYIAFFATLPFDPGAAVGLLIAALIMRHTLMVQQIAVIDQAFESEKLMRQDDPSLIGEKLARPDGI